MNRILWDAVFLLTGSLFTLGASQGGSVMEASPSIPITSTGAPNTSSASASTLVSTAASTLVSTSASTLVSTAASSRTTSSTTTIATPKTIPPVKKFVAAAVRFHFDDCPDSHRHFCFHGTCRFLILEETPACVCPSGFVGMRCEHADLLAVVATNQRGQTVATVLVLCVMGCALTMLFCTLLHCWWRRDYERRRRAFHKEKTREMLKGGPSFCPSESVV
ncbi:unnamed protein product [Boreogadus saida]